MAEQMIMLAAGAAFLLVSTGLIFAVKSFATGS